MAKKIQNEGDPLVVRGGFLYLQVCVPKSWTDSNVIAFAEAENPCGSENGWLIRKNGSDSLNGDPERQQCSEHKSHCHIMLDA
jgi:hypothetical protein